MNNQNSEQQASVIALRKSCSADGVGLSHYVLMDKEGLTDKKDDAEPASVIASRKSCSADGVGLSHYVLMDKEGQMDKEGEA